MRTSIPAGPALGLLRIFRPWMIATALGSALGAALLGLQNASPERFYNDPILRSAAQGFSAESAVEPDSGIETMFEARNVDLAGAAEAPFAPESPAPEPR